MKWLFALLAPIKSELFAMVGVLAVCGIGTMIASYLLIQKDEQSVGSKINQFKPLKSSNTQVRKYKLVEIIRKTTV